MTRLGHHNGTSLGQPTPTSTAHTVDPCTSAVACLATVMCMHGIAAEPHRLEGALTHVPHDLLTAGMVEAASACGATAALEKHPYRRLSHLPLPVIACLKDGTYRILLQVRKRYVDFQHAAVPLTYRVSREQFIDAWTGDIITVVHGQPDEHERHATSTITGIILRYKGVLAQTILPSIFLQVLSLASPICVLLIIDKVVVHNGINTLDALAAALVLVGVFELILSGVRETVFDDTSTKVDIEMTARLFRHLTSLPLRYFSEHSVGDMVSHFAEVDRIRAFWVQHSIMVCIDGGFTAVFLGLLFALHVSLALIASAAIPLYLILALLVTPLQRRRAAEQSGRSARNQHLLVETLHAIETIKALGVEAHFQRDWEHHLATFAAATWRTKAITNWTTRTTDLVSKCITVALLWVGTQLVITHELTLGQLVAFNLIAMRLSTPVIRLSRAWLDFQHVKLAVQRLETVLQQSPEHEARASLAPMPAITGQVQCDKMDFRYTETSPLVLTNISFTVQPGQTVGIVGLSGAGKSTLVKLLQGLLLPTSGAVRIDGIDTRDVHLPSLRRQCGVVLQDPILFARSVRDNIALGDASMSMDQVVAAAQAAGAHEFIVTWPRGYHTVLGERGITLSGGQRQRLALARALARHPKILILDEVTSALDYHSEQALCQRLQAMGAACTVIIVTHRLSMVRHADVILVLEHGQLIEQGSHDVLLHQRGRYASLYTHHRSTA